MSSADFYDVLHRNRTAIENLPEGVGSAFVYDLDALSHHVNKIANHGLPWLKIWYACKANPLSDILRTIKDAGWGVDVASTGELAQAGKTGFSPDAILSTGPAKSLAYFRHFLERGVRTFVAESLNQVYWMAEIAEEMQVRPRVLLRVQLPWNEGKSVLGGDDITPFGLGPADWTELDMARTASLHFAGFHIFQWGNVLDINKLEIIWRRIGFEIALISDQLGINTEVIDLGGGLGIPYQQDEVGLHFDSVVSLIKNLRDEFGWREVWMELGRYAVGECGMYLTKIIDRKTVRGTEILVTEGGINHIARPALVSQSFPCALVRESYEKTTAFQVHGPLCTALDKLGDFDLPQDTAPGDTLVFFQTGAYGFTEAMPFFLCHDLPAEIVIHHGQVRVVRPNQNASERLV